MIKKLAALTLALLMTLSMAACGSQKDDQAGGAVTPGVTGDAVPDMGTVSGGTYTNRFAGIRDVYKRQDLSSRHLRRHGGREMDTGRYFLLSLHGKVYESIP